MQLHGELDLQASRTEAAAPSPRKRKSLATRKVTIRLTEKLHEQLEAATERPGVGKSMVVAAALESFLNPRAPAEDPMRQNFDEMNARFDSLERDLRTIAETVGLPARGHLAVMPRLPQPQQRASRKLGDERFKILAEQVDRRVRLGQSLMQETIDRLNSTDRGGLEPAIDEDSPRDPALGQSNQEPAIEGVGIEHASAAAAGEGGSNSYFHHRPNAFCRPS
jgi:hypothetical protein